MLADFMDILRDPLVFTALFTSRPVRGSFLNVVIHRLPVMMEREWQAEAASLRGEEPDARRRASTSPRRARAAPMRPPIGASKTSRSSATSLLRGRCRHCSAHQRALSRCRIVLRPVGFCGLPLLASAWRRRRPDLPVGHDRAVLHRPRHSCCPTASPSPCCGWACCFNLGGTFTDLSSAVIGAAAGYWPRGRFLAVQARHRQGRHGLRRLQAARPSAPGWLADPAPHNPALVPGRGRGRHRLIVLRKHGREIPIPVRSLPRRRRAARPLLGQALTEADQAYLGSPPRRPVGARRNIGASPHLPAGSGSVSPDVAMR